MIRSLFRSVGTVLFAVLIAVTLLVAAITVIAIGFYFALWPPQRQASLPLQLAGRALRRRA